MVTVQGWRELMFRGHGIQTYKIKGVLEEDGEDCSHCVLNATLRSG